MSALENRKYVLQAEYDFDKDGGAVGDITLRGGGLPAGAVVTSGVVDVQTAVTSAGAPTVALAIEGAEDVLAETLKGALGVGLVDVEPDGTAANMIKTTVPRNIVATVAVAALTAGKINVALEYFITE